MWHLPSGWTTGGLALAVLLTASTSVRGQCTSAAGHDIDPTDGLAAQFGASVAVDGVRMVTGAPYTDLATFNSGAAYVHEFDGTTWNEVQRLEAGDADFNDLFGASVALQGMTLVVGAPLDSSGANSGGAAYVFQESAGLWTETQELLPTGLSAGDSFGASLALDGRWLVIGAPNKTAGGQGKAGCAYVYEWTGAQWSEFTKLEAPSPQSNDAFGTSVAIDGNVVAVGSIDDDTAMAEAGAVYLFEFDGTQWVAGPTLMASNPTVDGGFGADVDLHGSLLVVGSRAEQAYVYEYDGSQWNETILVGSDTQPGDEFGLAVAVEEMVLVGAPSSVMLTGPDAGAVYAFRHDGLGWRQVLKCGSATPTLDFGRSVDVVRDRLVAGASDSQGTGSVHALDVPDLALDASSNILVLGNPLTISTCGGTPSNLTALFVVQVNGSPFTQLLLTGLFDTAGVWTLPGSVPNDPAYQGLSVELLAFGLLAGGQVVTTNLQNITVL